jgi:hypothetical protein
MSVTRSKVSCFAVTCLVPVNSIYQLSIVCLGISVALLLLLLALPVPPLKLPIVAMVSDDTLCLLCVLPCIPDTCSQRKPTTSTYRVQLSCNCQQREYHISITDASLQCTVHARSLIIAYTLDIQCTIQQLAHCSVTCMFVEAACQYVNIMCSNHRALL